MKRGWVMLLVSALLLLPVRGFGVDGMFQGKVVDPPVSVSVKPGWIFVQGRNHMLRRVEVAHAEIVFGARVPASQQHSCRMECLEVGQEVRVTAEQDSNGEWRAKKVEILQLITNRI
jgi:hypothetical protein